jgi:nicotinamidase-related amidase
MLRLSAGQSVFLIVDLQTRLLPAIEAGEEVVRQALWLAAVAARLGVPILATEQYPRGLGPSLPELDAWLTPQTRLEKTHFSALAEGQLLAAPGGERRQWVVAGTEAHVCVQQTVLDLLAAGRRVYVVEEAVGSRRPRDKTLALARMRAHGAEIVSREMVAFEWLERADTPVFRSVLAEFIR